MASRRPPNCVIKFFEMLHVCLFLPTELHGSVPVLITRTHRAMFLRHKEGYFLFSAVLQNGFYYVTWNKFMHKHEMIITHHFGNLLLIYVLSSLLALWKAQNSLLPQKKQIHYKNASPQWDYHTRNHSLAHLWLPFKILP